MSTDITEKESKQILREIVAEYEEGLGINWDNHKKIPKKKNTFRITASALSLPALIHISEHERVKNVYFHPSVSPPGKGDAISLRYRLYIQYKN
jgi:hypothetical protein